MRRVFACGIMVHEALQAANVLAGRGVEITVADMFTVKPLDREAVIRYANKTGRVVAAENHNRVGGLTSAIAESLVGKSTALFGYVAVEDEFGEVGPQDYLQFRYGLTAKHIVDVVLGLVRGDMV